METAQLFYEDDLDALRAQVQTLGGYKIVGAKIWPDKTPDAAARLLADCCNSSRQERLKPSQVLLVMRMGREAGVHILAEHFMQEAGYERPRPVDPVDEQASLVKRMEDVMGVASQLATRLERLRTRGAA
jgi:hypothetical protein